ncbi:ubiquinol-cytochrome c reductase iron-sulfur subunit [Acuticoccus sp. I52.16.1]|uniref:ubiquinol-cytochrome c reductase iron-sulfur subunit n=1 Tax=Acuticoccus sp. I52.16.1 TaxID=2928472 RepID=UPI001FD36B66|nr:ubiquinol-cytochrome c reductase iron-sulfur subunit [Acuticoccus sp. I52.16.1]UOM33183.1 ubiquinol-cytochrome c reductase iron-sulfur subunit [Acuticoccus sp. I52.16.1]
MATTETNNEHGEAHGETRRDFLYIATGAVAAVGIGSVAWPFIDQMNPDAASLAMASTEANIGDLGEGESMTVMWRGKPVFIRRRTAEEVEAAKEVPMSDLKDTDARNPNVDATEATDVNRAVQGREDLLVMIGVCTHLGCIPLGQSGDYGGWFCPCHGSHYDTAGRIRKGPAPENLAIPPYNLPDESSIVIG